MSFSLQGWFGDRVDDAATVVKEIQEEFADEDAVILDGVPRAIQLDTYTCGAQCTHMVLACHGIRRSFRRLLKRLGTTPENGTTDSAIRRVLREEGLSPRTVRGARLSSLRAEIDRGAPCIALVDDEEHWLVVYGYDDEGFYVSDPAAIPSVYLETADFRDRWDRYFIAVRG